MKNLFMRAASAPIRGLPGLLLLGGILALLAWIRLPAAARDSVWAEDGRDFLADAASSHDWLVVFKPYAGYMHLVPRILAGITTWFPVAWWAQVLTILCCLTAGLIGVVVYVLVGQHDVTPVPRLLIAVLTVAAPALVYEVLGDAANLHALFLWSAPWLVLARPRTWRASTGLAVYAFFAASTEIQMAVFLPLLLWRFRRRVIPIAAACLAGLFLHAYALFHSDRPGLTKVLPLPGSIVDGFFLQTSMSAWLSSAKYDGALVWLLGWGVAYLSAAPFVVAAAFAVRRFRGTASRRVLVIVLGAGAVVIWAAGYGLNQTGVTFGELTPHELFARPVQLRYGVVPTMFLTTIVLLAVDRLLHLPAAERTRPMKVVLAASAAIGAVVLCVNFLGFGDSLRAAGPTWTASLQFGRAACDSPVQPASAQLPITPRTAPWIIQLDCSTIREGG